MAGQQFFDYGMPRVRGRSCRGVLPDALHETFTPNATQLSLVLQLILNFLIG